MRDQVAARRGRVPVYVLRGRGRRDDAGPHTSGGSRPWLAGTEARVALRDGPLPRLVVVRDDANPRRHESQMQRDRLMLADFDLGVTAVASQPFGLTGQDANVIRRHVPDYLLAGACGAAAVVEVKPAGQLGRPEVSASL